ncbi:hypothetical protein FRC01_002255 [Tulasnella sp. 417]|nr:hypothetical protein FRC01_002255 [Tulasnella sp. 417]
MSNRNNPNKGGGFMGGFGTTFGNFTGMSDPDPSKGRGNGHANAHAHSAGGAVFNRNAANPAKERGAGNAAGTAVANGAASEPPALPGLAELVEVLNAMAAAPLGARPHINQEVIERIKNSPLSPVLKGLNPVYQKLGPLEGSPEHLQAQAQAETAQRPETHPPTSQPSSASGPGPSSPRSPHTQVPATPGPSPPEAQQPPPTTAAMDVAELKNLQAGQKLLSSTLDSVAQVVADVNTRAEIISYFQTLEKNLRLADSETRETVKASATGAKTQIEAVDKKISQLSGKLDPLAELTHGVQRLQAGLLDEAKAERGRLEARNKELENQVKELQQIIHETRAELLPVEVASKIALHGIFSDEPDKKGSRGGTENAAGTVLQTAKKVRTNTLGLVAKCRVLFTFINRGPTTGAIARMTVPYASLTEGELDTNAPDFGTEGEWSRCVEHLQESNSKLRNAVEEKKETVQKLLFVGFVIEQIRKGHYTEEEWESDDDWKNFASLKEKSPDGFASIRCLAQDLAQFTAEATTPPVPNGPTPSTTLEGSQSPTAKPTNSTEALVEPDSTPAFTAPSSPDVPINPIPAKKDRDAKPPPTKKRSSSIRIKRVFNQEPGPLYGWGPIAAR